MSEFDRTDVFDKYEYKNEYIRAVLAEAVEAIENKGYDPVSQIMGYIETENPVYIPRDNGVREKISKIRNNEILEYLVYFFIKEK